MDQQDKQRESFESQAQEASPGLLREYVDFLKHNKKWWLIPLIGALLLVGALVIFFNDTATTEIYTLF
jgi:uncharacterized membrane protein HdeD (DUF308 family)